MISVTLIATGFSASNKPEYFATEAKQPERKILTFDNEPVKPVEKPAVAEDEMVLITKAPETEEVKMNFSFNTFTTSPVEEPQNVTPQNEPEKETKVEFNVTQDDAEMRLFTKKEVNEPSFVNEPVMNFDQPDPKITKKEDLTPEENEKFNKRQSERVINLREMSQKIKNQEGLIELEKIPAYIRRQTQLENNKPSSDSEISNLSLVLMMKIKPALKKTHLSTIT